MNVAGIQDTSTENMFVTMSSIGNVYFNTVIFQLRSLYPELFISEEEIFYLLGGVGFSYRCRRSKRKGTRIYTPTHQLNFRRIFTLLHQAECKDSSWNNNKFPKVRGVNESQCMFNKLENPKQIKISQNRKTSESLEKVKSKVTSHNSQNEVLFHHHPKTILEFRNAICEGMTQDRDIIFATYQRHTSSNIEHSEFDPFDLVSVQEDIMIDISNTILSYSKKSSLRDNSFQEEYYGQIRFFRLVEYDSVIVRVWDARNESIYSLSFREFWKNFDTIEVFTVPQNICRRTMYANAFHSIYESQTRVGGNLEGFIELQNALRRKSIRNSWWSLFCGDDSQSQKNTGIVYNTKENTKNNTKKKSLESRSTKDTDEFPSRIHKVISQLYVQLVLTTNGGYRKDMSRICHVLSEQCFLPNPNTSSLQKNTNKKLRKILQDIASLYASSSKKISFLGELLLSIDSQEAYCIHQGIDLFLSHYHQTDASDSYSNEQSTIDYPIEHQRSSQLEIPLEDRKEMTDWQSYFDLMDETISRILELESRVARKTLEMSNLLFECYQVKRDGQSEEVA